MTTCPYCDDIWLDKEKNLKHDPIYHVNCKCGYARTHSSWNFRKHEAEKLWENYIFMVEQNRRKEPKY